MAKSGKIRATVFEIVQYEKNRVTGEDLGFNEEVILKGLLKREKGLKNWAYIRHDKDVYVEGDDIPEGKYIGDIRPPHWHVVLQFNNQAELDSVANAFGVGENFVQKKIGAGAFFDCLYYLTHEDIKQQELGKHIYSRDEVKMPEGAAVINWDVVDAREEKRLKRLPQGLEVEAYIKKLSKGEVTLSTVFNESPVLFAKYQSVLKSARRGYLMNSKPPQARVNYYLQGQSGTGKTTAAKALARTLYPGVADDELFCIVSQETMFEEYDGQPVLIWDDWRPNELLSKFDRGMIWKLFAVNPTKTIVNVKYSSVNLINKTNIVTSVTDFYDFVFELSSEYVDSRKMKHEAEDENQAFRRFPTFIEIAKSSYDLFVSKSLTGGEYKDYIRVARVETSMVELAKNSSPENERKVLEPVLDLNTRLEEYSSQNDEIQDVYVNVKYDDGFDVVEYIPKDKRKDFEKGYEYFYTEECSNCHSVRNAVTKLKKYEGEHVFVEVCMKCNGKLFL